MIPSSSSSVLVFVRHFSRKCHRNLKRIDPKVPREDAKAISKDLSQILKIQGPLTVSDTWDHAKEAGISGLKSKTHLKLLLKWMRGRNMLKLFCAEGGKHKKFLHSVLPEQPLIAKVDNVSRPEVPTS